jgi:adenylate cyclase
VQQIALAPLGPAELDALLGELLGPELAASDLAARIRERTGGNPFFIEEVVVSLAEAGVLSGAKGRYRLAAPVEKIALPATVTSLLAARIDRLAEREKQALQTAAVIGPEFREATLGSVVDLPEAELAGALDRLVQAELLYEAELYPEREYAFKHPLTQEVAYGTQLAEKRARTHALVARALEAEAPDKLEERAALLAHHCEAAGEALAAARWHHVAALRASERDIPDGILHLRRAIALLDSAPETAEGVALGAEVRSSLLAAAVSQPISEEEIERLHGEASELARRSGDARLGVHVVLAHRWVAINRGGAPAAFESEVEEALAAAEQLGDHALQLRAWLILTLLRFGSDSLEGALHAGDRALELFEVLGERPRGAPSWGMRPALVLVVRGAVLHHQGRLAEARADFGRALRVSEEGSDLVNVSVVHGSIALLAGTLGDAGLARASALRARDTAAQTGTTTGLVLGEHGWGIASSLAGDVREAAAAHARALEQIRASNTVRALESEVLGKLAHALARLGDPLAREESLAAVHLPGSRPESAWLDRARVLRILDGLATRREIEDALHEAESLVRERGRRVSLPFVHEERAELALLLGDEATRARELAEARRLFLEMGAPLQAERIGTRLRESPAGGSSP